MMRWVGLLGPAVVVGVLVGCGKPVEAPSAEAAPVVSAPESPPVAAASGCPYLPEFVSLQVELPKLSAAEAADRLSRYAGQYSNPEGCEGTELERLLNGAESQLFHLAFGDTQHAAQLTLRCNEWDEKTTRCQGPVEDGTAHPAMLGVKSLALPETLSFRVESGMKNAKLLGVHVISLADALDGKPAQRLSGESKFELPSGTKDVAVVAAYEVQGTWRYRKVVWYF
jgi:hypothetical protein